MAMPFSSSASQMEVPAGASMVSPWGQYSACGRTWMVGMVRVRGAG